MNEFKHELEIDPDFLDVCLINQAPLLYKYSKMLEDAREQLDILKNQLNLLRSDIAAEIRKAPDKYGLEKITDKAIDLCVDSDDEYQDLYKQYLKQRHEVGVFQSAVFSINQRKESLENLVRLFGSKYFSSPYVGDVDLTERSKLFEQKRLKNKKSANEKIKSKLRRK
jgi:hypothetical protein